MRVLIVDDSAKTRAMVGATLANAGYATLDADNGIEALGLLKSNPVDLIISDVNMNYMGGFEFVSRVRGIDDFVSLPILFLTTESSEEFRAMGHEVGANGWLTKPFDPDELIQVIRRVLQ